MMQSYVIAQVVPDCFCLLCVLIVLHVVFMMTAFLSNVDTQQKWQEIRLPWTLNTECQNTEIEKNVQIWSQRNTEDLKIK